MASSGMLQPPADLLAPLSLRVTLGEILLHAPAAGICGVWVEPDPDHPLPRLPISVASRAGTVALLLGPDLAGLAVCTAQVLVRRGPDVCCIGSDVLRELRRLEITDARGRRMRRALGASPPESVLADWLAAGRSVAASRIVYAADAHSVDSPRSPPLG